MMFSLSAIPVGLTRPKKAAREWRNCSFYAVRSPIGSASVLGIFIWSSTNQLRSSSRLLTEVGEVDLGLGYMTY